MCQKAGVPPQGPRAICSVGRGSELNLGKGWGASPWAAFVGKDLGGLAPCPAQVWPWLLTPRAAVRRRTKLALTFPYAVQLLAQQFIIFCVYINLDSSGLSYNFPEMDIYMFPK